jgi:hypothetical protein
MVAGRRGQKKSPFPERRDQAGGKVGTDATQHLIRGALAGDPSHFAEAIIREILSLSFFDGL